MGVDAEVEMVSVPAQVGVHVAALNAAVAPPGSPEAARLIAWVVPACSVAVIVVAPLLPWATKIVPALLSA